MTEKRLHALSMIGYLIVARGIYDHDHASMNSGCNDTRCNAEIPGAMRGYQVQSWIPGNARILGSCILYLCLMRER